MGTCWSLHRSVQVLLHCLETVESRYQVAKKRCRFLILLVFEERIGWNVGFEWFEEVAESMTQGQLNIFFSCCCSGAFEK